MKEFIYFNPKYKGCTGVLTVYGDGFLTFEIAGRWGPVNGIPESWDPEWTRIGAL